MKVLFWTDFNTRLDSHLGPKNSKHPALCETWLVPRFQLWKDTCWASILRQTRKDWIYVIRCHPQAEAITRRLFARVKDPRFHITHMRASEEHAIILGLANRLPVYTVRLDSDDMYHPAVCAEIAAETRNYLWFYWKHGYAYNHETDELYTYDTRKVGPFFAHKYIDKDAFIDKAALTEPGHDQILKKAPVQMKAGRFMVGLSRMNTTTNIGLKHVGPPVTGAMRAHVLGEYGNVFRNNV
jgi:hypothetical protein